MCVCGYVCMCVCACVLNSFISCELSILILGCFVEFMEEGKIKQ